MIEKSRQALCGDQHEGGHRNHICQKYYATTILGPKHLHKKAYIVIKTNSQQNHVNALKGPLTAHFM